ncbi:putative histidine kinase-like protein M3YPp [Clohesyomyces aquaticus]|uniref:histidine kinase n=1 Tax=Clohesyomyces aquaticus TaxID=1231657 RepID=A0A1Y1YUR2_9PLEO|nr:putative histidine kinase-like protein M3YPp [Clohesyomyces aquaticus]
MRQGVDAGRGAGQSVDPDVAPPCPSTPTPTPTPTPSPSLASPPSEVEDWTADLVQTPHVHFFRSTDWASSRLGPLETWSPTLRLFVRMIFADSRAACLWWEPDLVAIYNGSYRQIAAKTHPRLMGRTFLEGWPELWDGFEPIFEQARQTGLASEFNASRIMTERLGWKEESYFTGNIVPIGGGPCRKPEGFYNSCLEITSQCLAERRTNMLNKMASVSDLAPDGIYTHIMSALETNGYDIPMAMLYEAEQASGSTVLHLRGHIGIPNRHELLVDGENITSPNGLIPDCRRSGSSTRMIDLDDRFNQVSWRGFEQPSKKIAIMPIATGSRIFGYLISGTNPCRPLDGVCEQFIQDLGRMASSIMTAAVSRLEAKAQQQQLENDLAFSDMKLRHLIEHASVGMVHVSLAGTMMWANDHYHALTNELTAQHRQSQGSFFDKFLEEDRPKARELWAELAKGRDHVNAELRTNLLWKPPVGDDEPTHLQVLAFSYRENGELKSIMACTTDISRLKWAERFQKQLAIEAREAKKQQEAFIDVVSHEMRNPLSAIVHCAQGITTCLDECRSRLAKIPQPCLDILTENVGAADIIMQCANHQKRIIDDVLTLSRLDSMLLSITPTATKPARLVDNIVRMFDAELKSSNIKCDVQREPSFKTLRVEHLYLDPSRVTQVFINLLTNAIKFVKTVPNPRITIRYGATAADPRSTFVSQMFWAQRGKHEADVTNDPEWGTAETIYLTFLVSDNGIGMDDGEIQKVFDRFKQANPRTHVKYGGSGLGLFISKELTEKQGGEIGVVSAQGHGSTFGFYIKSRRVERTPQASKDSGHKENKTPVPQQLRVLNVEDNVINQRVLGKLLKKAGFVVHIANHGLEALNALEREQFDIVLMDSEMPVMDGMSATKEIRRRQREGQLPEPLPIIAVTANTRPEQVNNAIAAGADLVVTKPFEAPNLFALMRDLVLRHDMSLELPEAPGDSEDTAGFIT